MLELEKILEEIEAEFDRRIGTQLKIMAGLSDDVYRYGYGKGLEAYQQGKLLVEEIVRTHMDLETKSKFFEEEVLRMNENIYMLEGEEDYRKGLSYLYMEPVTMENIRSAFDCFNKAANSGHVESKYQLGILYEYGMPPVLRNLDRAAKCFKEAADGGIALAQYQFGIYSLSGTGVEKNVEEGIRYLELAANQGIGEAANCLAEIYLRGNEVPEDLGKAKFYNDKARKFGVPDASKRMVEIISLKREDRQNNDKGRENDI